MIKCTVHACVRKQEILVKKDVSEGAQNLFLVRIFIQ